MPSHSGKRPYEQPKKWGGGGGRNTPRRDDRRTGVMQNRLMGGGGGGRLMVSPWENGMTPGMQSNLLSQNTFSQQAGSSYLMNTGLNRGNFGGSNFAGFGNGNKMRRFDRMGGFDDQRGRGLLPSPSNTPLLGVAPPAFHAPHSGPEFLQQRMGVPWSSAFRSGAPRGMGSGYYPSNRGPQDNSRKFLKAKRPQNKPTVSNKSSSSKDGKGKLRNSTSSHSTSVKGKEDKEKAPAAHSKDLKNKQGGASPPKSERQSESDKQEKEKESKDEEDEHDKEEVKKENEEELEEDKEKDDKDESEKTKEEKENQQEDQFPVEALYCHICDLDSFSSRKGYIRHLQGITHAKMAELFHAKNAATLELLNISAKLAEMRQRDKTLRRTGKKGQPVMKTTEQVLVQKWVKVGFCCGMKFKSPFDLEEHKLSIHHLKTKHTLKLKNEKAKEEEAKAQEEQIETSEEETQSEVIRQSSLLKEARKNQQENPLTMQSLSIYDPSVIMGLQFIKEELKFHCAICKGQPFKSLENHCQSHTHYDTIASYLNKVEDKKREDERKKEEMKKEEEEKEKQAKKESNEEEKKEETKVEESKKEKEPTKEEAEEEEEDGAEYIMVDCSEDKEKSDDEIDEDVIPLGEDEERILNASEDGGKDEEAEEGVEDDIFEEIGEKIDLEDDLKKQVTEEEEEEEEDVEPPSKRMACAQRRGRRGRGRRSK